MFSLVAASTTSLVGRIYWTCLVFFIMAFLLLLLLSLLSLLLSSSLLLLLLLLLLLSLLLLKHIFGFHKIQIWFVTLELKNKDEKYLKSRKISKKLVKSQNKKRISWWQVRLPTERQNRSKLVDCEKGPKFKNKGTTWLSTAQDGAHRKTVHFGSSRKVPWAWLNWHFDA